MSAEMSDEKKSDPATLDVQEEVKLNSPDGMDGEPAKECHEPGVDCRDRDPNQINDHVKVRFNDVFAEPDEEVYSFEKIWVLSFKIFTLTKVWFYRILSLIFAIPCAICWGLNFACLAFCNIWCAIPYLKTFDIDLFCVRRSWEICLGTFLGPLCAATGKCCGGINVKVNKEIV